MTRTMLDWNGNKASTQKTGGFSNHCDHDRGNEDYYATEDAATEWLLRIEKLVDVWECACGGGHMAEVLRRAGVLERASDKVNRGYGEVADFLTPFETWHGDIVTNPPYKYANDFIERAIEMLQPGHKLALFLPIRYLEGKERRNIFDKYPPVRVWVSSSRLRCDMNGDFGGVEKSGAVAYAWFVWEKGYTGTTELRWFN